MRCAMRRFDRIALPGRAAAAVILLVVVAWPSRGWSKARLRVCEVQDVQRLLDNWASALEQSWQPQMNPTLIVNKYGTDAVLLPTCKNGPLIGHLNITGYFRVFLADKPVVEGGFVHPNVGGDCNVAFASGLYTFKLNGGTPKEVLLHARYTYIFRHELIVQHHSSLEPDPPGAACPH